MVKQKKTRNKKKTKEKRETKTGDPLSVVSVVHWFSLGCVRVRVLFLFLSYFVVVVVVVVVADFGSQ